MQGRPDRAHGRYRSADRTAHDGGDAARRRPQRVVRHRSDASGPARQRRPVPPDAGRSEPRQRVVLSRRSARPCGVRHADRAPGCPWPCAGHGAARRRSRDADRPPDVVAHAGRSDRRSGDRGFERSRRRIPARGGGPQLLLSARLLLDRQARWQVPLDHRPREATGRAGARATRLSRRYDCGRDRCGRRECERESRAIG